MPSPEFDVPVLEGDPERAIVPEARRRVGVRLGGPHEVATSGGDVHDLFVVHLVSMRPARGDSILGVGSSKGEKVSQLVLDGLDLLHYARPYLPEDPVSADALHLGKG